MKTRITLALLALSLAANLYFLFFPRTQEKPTPPDASNRPELVGYKALGSFLAENNAISRMGWTEEQFGAFQQGMLVSFRGKPVPMNDQARAIKEAASKKLEALAGPAEDPIERYFATLRDKEKVLKTGSNLHYRITQQGFGKKPGPSSVVVASLTARLPNGDALPSLSGARMKLSVKDMLPGMAEGVQLLKAGGKELLYLPPSLSYGNGTWPSDIPKGAPIIFFLELHEVTK